MSIPQTDFQLTQMPDRLKMDKKEQNVICHLASCCNHLHGWVSEDITRII